MTGLLDKLNNHGIKNISSVLNNPNKELTFQVINWIRNAIVFKGKINLQKLLVQGSIYVLISSSVGVLLFFVVI